jgi:23S rRNA (guanosine2251-2'-O)-methyltransferase
MRGNNTKRPGSSSRGASKGPARKDNKSESRIKSRGAGEGRSSGPSSASANRSRPSSSPSSNHRTPNKFGDRTEGSVRSSHRGGRTHGGGHGSLHGISKAAGGRWVVGIHSVLEALKVRPNDILEFCLKEDFEKSNDLRLLAEKAEVLKVSAATKTLGALDAICSGHQGVAVRVSSSPTADFKAIASEETSVILALDGIEDPQNLGAIVRTAWLAKVSAILIPAERAVGLTASVAKVASGGAEHVPIETCSNLAQSLQELKDQGFWIYGLAEAGTGFPWQFELAKKIVWVVGSESSGLRKTSVNICDELVKIPQIESGSSYNAGVATAMALYETVRQSSAK